MANLTEFGGGEIMPKHKFSIFLYMESKKCRIHSHLFGEY